jgi:methionyl-tRNA formyltransferase
LTVVFFGTPAFAVPPLRALAADPRFAVTLVVTQPDRPAGRGRRLEAPPVKGAAEALGLPVYQTGALRTAAERAPLVASDADLFVVAAFGVIFGVKTLAIPRLGCVNVHASLLPAYRGASPIAAALLAGEGRTGVSLMVMARGLDTGPVFAAADLDIEPANTTASLTGRLSELGADLAVRAIPRYAVGELTPRPQGPGATLTRPLVKADGWLDWARPAEELERRVRAMWPWPRAWTTIAGEAGQAVLQVHAVRVSPLTGAEDPVPGTVLVDGGALAVATGAGGLVLETAQLPGGRPLPGSALRSGRHLKPGDVLGRVGAPPASVPLVTEVVDLGADREEA